MYRITAVGSAICFASGLAEVAAPAAADSTSQHVVIFLGIVTGIGIGFLGVIQKMRDSEIRILLARQTELYEQVRTLQNLLLTAQLDEKKHVIEAREQERCKFDQHLMADRQAAQSAVYADKPEPEPEPEGPV